MDNYNLRRGNEGTMTEHAMRAVVFAGGTGYYFVCLTCPSVTICCEDESMRDFIYRTHLALFGHDRGRQRWHETWANGRREASTLPIHDQSEAPGWEPSITLPLSEVFDRDYHDSERGIQLYACVLCGHLTTNRVIHLQMEHGARSAANL